MLCFRSRAPWRMVAVPSAARAHTARSACPPGRQALRDSERGTHQTASAQLTRDSNPTRSCPSVSCASASRDGCTSSGWVMSSTDREKSSGPRIPEGALERRVHALEVAVEADDAQEVDREVEELLQLGPGLRQMRRARVDALLPFPAIMAENERLTVPHRHATDPERGPRPRRVRRGADPRLEHSGRTSQHGRLVRWREVVASAHRAGVSVIEPQVRKPWTTRPAPWVGAHPVTQAGDAPVSFPPVPTRRWPTGRSSARIWLSRALSCSAPERIRTSDLRFRRPTR